MNRRRFLLQILSSSTIEVRGEILIAAAGTYRLRGVPINRPAIYCNGIRMTDGKDYRVVINNIVPEPQPWDATDLVVADYTYIG